MKALIKALTEALIKHWIMAAQSDKYQIYLKSAIKQSTMHKVQNIEKITKKIKLSLKVMRS